MRRLLNLLLVLFAAVAAVAAQAANDREATVGMRGRIEELVLPGSELVVAPATHETPIVLRIIAVRAHGDRYRYDLEWSGLDPGTFDLTKYLVRKDGSSLADLPAVEVTVASVLPEEARHPTDSEPLPPPRVGGYGIEQAVAVVLWIVGLLAILFLGRKRRRAAAAPPPAPATLADRLRPFVEAAAAGNATDGQKAELERLLVAFWRERLDLQDVKADQALLAIQAHGEAGLLLRQFEAWLHMPHPPQEVDLPALLAPYRGIAADAIDLGSKAGTGAEPR